VITDFPPTPEHPDQISGLLEVYRSLIDDREAWYVSTPLTTGKLFREISSQHPTSQSELEALLAELVIEPNRRQAEQFVRKLRSKTRYVINPAAVHDIEGWTQGDYRYFWGLVIEQFSECVVFRDGWHLSSGCSWEFLVAIRAGVITLDESLAPLGVKDGVLLLRRSLTKESATNSEFLRRVLSSLREMTEKPHA
jgi:hypothetical protein